MSNNRSKLDICHQVESWLDSYPETASTTMTALAKSMNLSVRTLRRRLAERQTTFSAVFENWRIANAKRLLRQPELTIQSIAQRLGYAYESNFERSFKRWTGLSPSAFRTKGNDQAGLK